MYEKNNILKYILLLEMTKYGIKSKSEFLYAFIYSIYCIDAELRRRLPNKVAVLLKVGIVCSERTSSGIQGTNNTA